MTSEKSRPQSRALASTSARDYIESLIESEFSTTGDIAFAGPSELGHLFLHVLLLRSGQIVLGHTYRSVSADVNSVEGRLKRIAREEAIKNAWLIQGKEFDVMNDRIEITGKPRFINKIRPRKAVHSIDSPSEAIHGEGSEENEAKSENKSVKGTKERRFRNALNEWALRLLGSFVALIIFILFGVAIFLAYWLLNNDHDILGGALIIFIGVVGFAIYAKLQEEH